MRLYAAAAIDTAEVYGAEVLPWMLHHYEINRDWNSSLLIAQLRSYRAREKLLETDVEI